MLRMRESGDLLKCVMTACSRVLEQVAVFCLQKNGCGSPSLDCRGFFICISPKLSSLAALELEAADCPMAAS